MPGSSSGGSGPSATERPPVHGSAVDGRARCAHYRGPTDIVAIRFPCCDRYYACHLCHDETADHAGRPWPPEARDERAALCGACGHTLTIAEYLDCGYACPACGARFNPGCARHDALYFS